MTLFLEVITNFLRTIASNMTKFLAIETLQLVPPLPLCYIGYIHNLEKDLLRSHSSEWIVVVLHATNLPNKYPKKEFDLGSINQLEKAQIRVKVSLKTDPVDS
ncbi:hypothetical protein CIPAW_09G224200 [Carya illinoinensis]|uniref:Uncharacterized protein n=1 Tax=Carya illinoinensis TaxID=32201 RepID=A0A8T1PN97_CARIL|nr:hypothetical protein CIPAW_09G224200 [Carya illinoinensis]